MKNDPQKFAENINTKVLPKLRILDWALAFATLGWGIWTLNWIWTGIGVLGVVLAWLDPGSAIKRWLERVFLGRGRRPVAPPIAMPAVAMKNRDGDEKARVDGVLPDGDPWSRQQKPVVIRSRDGLMSINYGMAVPLDLDTGK